MQNIDFNWMLLALSGVVLTSYLYDMFGRKMRVPAVVMMISTGIGLRVVLDLVGWELHFMEMILPILGTLGLVLIVLEGALELKLSRSARERIIRSGAVALLGVVLTGWALAAAIRWAFDASWWQAWVVATPFAVISSAVAIPAAAALRHEQREQVVYESAMSDIFGVLLFYALLDTDGGVAGAVFNVFAGVTASALIGTVTGLAMLALIGRIVAHVRFVPMIFGLVFVYAASKLSHLAPLVSVLAVGLLLNNTALYMHWPPLGRMLPDALESEVDDFKHLTAELTFVVRTFFFLLLGYSTPIEALTDQVAWLMAGGALLIVLVLRKLILHLIGGAASDGLVWFAPRGLITVLLALNVPPEAAIEGIPQGTLMLIVLGSALAMTIGTLRAGVRTSAA